jgi:hypothetical protein
VPRFILLTFFFLVSSIANENAYAQAPRGADSSRYALPADSLHVLDSAYRARKAVLDKWIHEQRQAAHPQEDFLSVYAEYGGYIQILPRDINQLFSERTLRPSPLSDRNNYGTVDRAIILGGAAQLTPTWGIYAEYDYTAKFLNTLVDSTSPNPPSLLGIEEALDMNEHAFVVGGTFVFYSSRFYRLRASGGIGAVIALTSETEAGGAARSASATGFQFNSDLLNDFRIVDNASFTIDFLFRSISTGTLKTSGGQTLDAPFGRRTNKLTVASTASNLVYGFAAGFVYYF